DEKLSFDGTSLGLSLLDFWRWSYSDILSNTMRGVLAEFIVATALGIDIKTARKEWEAFDLLTENNLKVEVKSCAYLQTWKQNDYSKIGFSCGTSKSWDYNTDKRSNEAKRHADVYVFCLLKHKIKSSINPLDLNQWEFYVVK